MEDFEEIQGPDVTSMAVDSEDTPQSSSTQASISEPFEEVPAPPAPCGRETTPVLPLKQALFSASLDPARMYEMQDRRAAKTTTGSFTVKHEELYYNVMAVGASGLGKTTLLRNLFQGYAKEVQLPTPGRRSYDTIDNFIRNPESYIWAPFRVIDESTCKSVQVRVVDVPGHGFEVDMPHKDYVNKLLKFVLQQKAKDYETYTSKVFHADITGKLRSTLSVCLYFLSPYTMRPLDVVLIAALSKEVPVIPVIAMSDAMTPAKRTEYSQLIMSQLLNPKRLLPNWGSDSPVEIFPVSKDDKEKLGVDGGRMLPPFAVMGSEDVAAEHEDHSDYCPVIHTMAGSLEVMNRHYCDTILLKRFLLGDSCDGFWRILAAATTGYLDFCEKVEAMSEKRMEKKLSKMAEEISVACQYGNAEFYPAVPRTSSSVPPPSSAPPSTPVRCGKKAACAPTPAARSAALSQPSRSRCCSVWGSLLPVWQVLLVVLLVFGAFLAGTQHAAQADVAVAGVGSSNSDAVPKLGDRSWSSLHQLDSLSSTVLDNIPATAEPRMIPVSAQSDDSSRTCKGISSVDGNHPPAASPQIPTQSKIDTTTSPKIDTTTSPKIDATTSPEIDAATSQPQAPQGHHTQHANSNATNTETPTKTAASASKGDDFFSTVSSTLTSTAQLPPQEAVKAWTQEALSWVSQFGQRRPRVVRRSRVLVAKAASQIMKKLEEATQQLKCKVGGQAGGEECSQ